MATQFADIAPRPFPVAPPRNPNIRVAFVAGPAVQAVSAELSKLPDPTRTLDEMVGGGKAERIEQLAAGLSAPMRPAFYHWLDVCFRVEESTEQDDIDNYAGLHDDAIFALMEIPAVTMTDLMLKAHIWAIDAGPPSMKTLGPIGVDDNVGGFRADLIPVHVGRDLLRHFPLSGVLNGLMNTRPAGLTDTLRRYADNLPNGPWVAQFDEAVEAIDKFKTYERDHMQPINELHAEFKEKGLDTTEILKLVREREAVYGELSCLASAATEELFVLQMPNFRALETAVDMAASIDLELNDDDGRIMEGVTGNVADLVSSSADDTIMTAFAGLRREMIAYHARPADSDPREDDAADLRVDKLEEVLVWNPARTLSGVIAKLRLAFQHKAADGAWSDDVMIDPTLPAFKRSVEMADHYDRLLWSAIDDLARVAGIDLEEHGA